MEIQKNRYQKSGFRFERIFNDFFHGNQNQNLEYRSFWDSSFKKSRWIQSFGDCEHKCSPTLENYEKNFELSTF